MIDKTLLKETVEKAIDGTSIFLVDLQVNPGNNIVVEIDSPDGIDIDTCADITRKIEAEFDRDKEDYELEVGSAGLTSPFKVKGQYLKNIGNQVEVLTKDGKKIKGTLTSVSDIDGTFTVETVKKVKEPGKKKPVEVAVPETFPLDGCKYVKYLIDFK
ncbi:MAG: ribosome assembly cofactor RimP [Muribaculum sp.]|nr:ribosome assembly cofactor RimP [Muribaculum sp.]